MNIKRFVQCGSFNIQILVSSEGQWSQMTLSAGAHLLTYFTLLAFFYKVLKTNGQDSGANLDAI